MTRLGRVLFIGSLSIGIILCSIFVHERKEWRALNEETNSMQEETRSMLQGNDEVSEESYVMTQENDKMPEDISEEIEIEEK